MLGSSVSHEGKRKRREPVWVTFGLTFRLVLARFSSRSVEKRWKLELIMIHTNTNVIALPKLQIIATLEALKVEGEDMFHKLRNGASLVVTNIKLINARYRRETLKQAELNITRSREYYSLSKQPETPPL
ncbi:hypothetical protein Peur_020016 [Populus x canadensis]